MAQVHEFIGVYHADGGLVGETKYVLGKFLGRAHCALCDITHSPVRRKPSWDRMVDDLGVPFRLLHLNELPGDVSRVAAASGSPVVLSSLDTGLSVALPPAVLDTLDGSVDGFDRALRSAMRANDWQVSVVGSR